MKYQALYRKYRPTSFENVVGQDIIIKTLKNSLRANKISHAYMFSGPRGTGKTTVAKILAKNINCLELENGMACGKCKNCVSIQENMTTDIIEIDAASNNGVDEIREIRSKINLVPSELNYKIYIIDEVHMLSIGAFNALLKTLEEPPAHIIFILATTDPHKVPVTIISRCQCFNFQRISINSMMERLKQVCTTENISIDDKVLEKISQCSDGGLRDALGMLDKLASYTDNNIKIDDLEQVYGILSIDYANDFLNLVLSGKISPILVEIDEIHASGKDLLIFCQDLMEILRNDLVNYYTDGNSLYDPNFSLDFVKLLNHLLSEMKTSGNIKIVFEIGILSFISESSIKIISCNRDDQKVELSSNNSSSSSKEIISREIISTENVEKTPKIANKVDEKSKNISFNDNDYQKRKNVIVNNTFVTANKNFLSQTKKCWENLNEYTFDKEYGAAAGYLIDSTVRAVGEHEIIISVNYDSTVQRGIAFISKIGRLLEKILNISYNVAILSDEEWELEKNKYIENKNNNVVYSYIDYKEFPFHEVDSEVENNTSSMNLESDSFVDSAVQLFGKDIVKIS